jgi:hypothetical protein
MTYEVAELMQMFHAYRAYKQPYIEDARLIRSLYRGGFWRVFSKNLKDYTITPDWNYYEYVVQAFLNSVYSGSFIGTITPRRAEDEKQVEGLNAFLAYQWNKWGLKNKYLHIGENGELYNLGGVRIDWTTSAKDVKVKSVSFDEVYLDPAVTDYREGAAVFLERSANISKLQQSDDFGKASKAWFKKNENNIQDKTRTHKLAGEENRVGKDNQSVSLIECFIRNTKTGKVDQVYILNEEEIIYENTDTGLDRFPVVLYQPSTPDGGPYGQPRLLKIFNTVVALNLIDSMEATQPYRMLNRVRFVNVDGRINMRSFADYGNTPGASFEVKGPPKDIISFEDVQTIPDMNNLKARLESSIFQVTGVDPYYKGRMTNSIQTTGATQAFQARVTMLTDNSKITKLEEFCEELTRVIIDHYYIYGAHYEVPKLSASGTNKVVDHFSIDFPKMEGITYDYNISASSLLPMNQANLFESAKALYEMQGQYNFSIPLVTPQDLVRYSDFPQKDLWLQRLDKQERENTAETLVADLTNFASIFSRLLSQGLSEEQAAQQAISILIEEKNAMKENPALGRGFE